MTRTDAQRITEEYLKPVYGFALKRCRTHEDAEDLAQEIITRAFSVLLQRDDIGNPEKFIWTMAHNALANYYRDHQPAFTGIPIEDAAELIPDGTDLEEDFLRREAVRKLRSEIAYLSRLQRQIVIAHYFENRKQSDIAEELGIPVGTVKWHLFEAKKELKRGMDMTRPASDLKFNPVKFHSIGINGSSGSKSIDDFFRSVMNQNICYSVRNRAKTVGEIADDLGVSPVYIEEEADYLEEYGLLKKEKDGYIVNFLIAEPTRELLLMQDAMYKKAAALMADDLYDELIASGLPDDGKILCHQSGEAVSLTSAPERDRNFILWSLIPWILAQYGEDTFEEKISFDSVATLRPDGGHNIIHAAVVPDNLTLPDDYVRMNNWCGPMWNQRNGRILWQIDSQWSDRGEFRGQEYRQESGRILALYEYENDSLLSPDDYAWLCEKGYLKTCGTPDTEFKTAWQIVILEDCDIKSRLLAVGKKTAEKHADALEALKKPYITEVLKTVPAHLRRLKEYELQYLFASDGWFLLHCIRRLLDTGRLKEPAEHQRKALTTLMLPV